MHYRFNSKTLLYEKTSLTKNFLIGLGFSVGLFLTMALTTKPNYIRTISSEERLIIINEHNSFSEKKLIKKIKELNFRFPHIVLAQAKLESGNFNSNIFIENNNMFGMREAFLRVNLSKGTNRQHAYYDNWVDSLLDYALYYSTYLYKLKTEEQYFEYLKQNYAEDKAYVDRIKYIIKKQNLKVEFKK